MGMTNTLAMYRTESGLASRSHQGLLTPPPDRRSRTTSTTSEHEDTINDISALQVAVRAGDLSEVRRLFDKGRSHGHPVERFGSRRTSQLLMQSLDQGNARLADYLINQDVPFSTTHVECAITKGLNAFLAIFIQRGWDINESNPQGRPLLVNALSNIGLVSWFLAHGADPNKRTPQGTTPLSIAVANHTLEHVLMLRSYGGSVNTGYPLHFAVSRNDAEGFEMAKYLLKHGANVNTLMCEDDKTLFQRHRTEGLGSPLHYAVSVGSISLVRLLLQHGADPLLHNTLGRTSLDLAADSGYAHLLAALREKSSVPTSTARIRQDTNMSTQRQHISIADVCN